MTVRPSQIRAKPSLVAAIGQPCPYCGKPMTAPTRDHIRPRIKGGTLEPGNRAIVCEPCNYDKGARKLDRWQRRLARAGDPRALVVQRFIEIRSAPTSTGSPA